MQTLMNANRLYAKRAQGEQYPTVAALVAAAQEDKTHSAEVLYNWKDLNFVADQGNVKLASPRATASLTHWSFGQACQSLESPAAYLRDRITPDLAAACLNHRIRQTTAGEDARLRWSAGCDG